MNLDVEKLLELFNCFFSQLEQVALPADKQIESIKIGIVTDEIALNFCEMGMPCAKQLYENNWITTEQYNLVKELYEKFDEMSDTKYLWNDESLVIAPEWEKCRQLARRIMEKISA